MPRHYTQQEMDRRGIANPIKRCPKCGQSGPIVQDNRMCVACAAKAHNAFKKLTLKDKK